MRKQKVYISKLILDGYSLESIRRNFGKIKNGKLWFPVILLYVECLISLQCKIDEVFYMFSMLNVSRINKWYYLEPNNKNIWFDFGYKGTKIQNFETCPINKASIMT